MQKFKINIQINIQKNSQNIKRNSQNIMINNLNMLQMKNLNLILTLKEYQWLLPIIKDDP